MARRRLSFADFLFSESVAAEDDLWTATSFPSRKPTSYASVVPPYWQEAKDLFGSDALKAQDVEVKERGFLGISLPHAPGWRTALLLGAGAAAAGGAAFFLLQPAPGATTAPTAATAEAAATDPNPDALLQELAQIRADLQGLVGDGPEERQRRAELQERLTTVELQLETVHSEMLAARTLRQLAAADALRRSNGDANSFLRMVYDKVAPAFAQLEALRRVIDLRINAVSTRVPQLISEEVEGATDEIKGLFQSALPLPRFNIAEQLPPMTMLLAGLLAPVQLRLMWGDNLVRLALSGAILSLDVVSLLLAHGTKCMSQGLPVFGTIDALHFWIGVDAFSLFVTAAVSAMVVKKAGATIAEVDAASEISLDTAPGTDPEEAFRANMEKQLLAGAKAIVMYDSLAGSSLNRLPPVLALFDFFWQAGGLFIIFDTPGASCSATFLLDWARGREIIFLVGFVPMIVGVGVAAVRLAVSSPAFSQAVLETAANIDEVCTILVRSFLVRDVTDIAGVKLQVARAEEAKLLRARDKVQAERDAAEAKLTSTQADLDAAVAQVAEQEEVVAMHAPEQEFLTQYRRAVAEAMALSQTAEALRCRIAKHGAEEKEDAAQSPVAAAAGGIQAEATAEVAPAAAGVEVEDLEEQDGDADMGGTGGSARGSAQ
ncbi:hypothetical protein AK812_SmicGene8292 [Symbiodinium microadriaticum]|uniref:Uncharacterized protein n=1 Tax=Symbiodinium microadriaticum TaxID=2951 RepID=A0A1Q9ELE5_SYMMI|nr:hypothetical protein AK812_SmicGene8292 [Symbiodinium microadriaticum]